MASHLNMNDRVTPFWDVAQFESFAWLSPKREFNLISAIAFFFVGNTHYMERARSAWAQLVAMGHPLCVGVSQHEMVRLKNAPAGLEQRYNALFMFLVVKANPSASFGYDKCGRYEVKHPQGAPISGDFEGWFPLGKYAFGGA